jgi:hypothetical protein
MKGKNDIEQKDLEDWKMDLKQESINKSAEYEIFPKLLIPNIPTGEVRGKAVKVEILEDKPKKITIPQPKYNSEGFVLSVKGIEDETNYSLWLPKSLRFKLAVLQKQTGIFKGMKIAIWKVHTDLDNYPDAIVYDAQIIQ